MYEVTRELEMYMVGIVIHNQIRRESWQRGAALSKQGRVRNKLYFYLIPPLNLDAVEISSDCS
jgi:hypothetical protein